MRNPAGRVLAFVAMTLVVLAAKAAAPDVLRLSITEGRVQNFLYRSGPVAAHVVVTGGTAPRLLVAFPAGNSGVGLWFGRSATPVNWRVDSVEPVSRDDPQGRRLHGVVVAATVDAPLAIRDALLGSVRSLRDFQATGAYPEQLRAAASVSGQGVEWARARIDGAAGYSLSIAAENGRVGGGSGSPLRLEALNAAGPLRLRITALTGETPLTPLGTGELLTKDANDDPRSRDVLGFLSYREKFLAGSWRFDTYFGRDTLLSLQLLRPVLQPPAIESGITAVLQRLAPNGEVAHEEDIGEFAVLRHLREGGGASAAPIYDYKMIDDDFLLAPLAAGYLLGQSSNRARAAEFLAGALPGGERIGSALARNFVFVVQAAKAFADQPIPGNLVSLKTGFNVGNWRDSEQGLASGRYPYDVNAVFVPAAANAIAAIVRAGILDRYLSSAQRALLAQAGSMAATWSREAPRLFEVRIDGQRARAEVEAYAAELQLGSATARESSDSGPLTFFALALDARGKPIPVLHSDVSFALFLQDPPAGMLAQVVASIMRPFPAGLVTDAGLLVANPVHASEAVRRAFDRNAYHGTVTWSWQQALLAAGLERQLARSDLPAPVLAQLRTARARLGEIIQGTRELRTSELWSWRYDAGRFHAVPFGQRAGDADESNAAQLWSSVYLAIPVSPPAAAGGAPRTPAETYPGLFERVQLERVYDDGKTFVDAVPRAPPDEIMEQYRKLSAEPGFDLKAFVEARFDAPRSGPVEPEDIDRRPVEQHIDALWNVLARPPDNPPPNSSLLPLPFRYVVPGGRFREIYYWDSYFTMLGLEQSGRHDLAVDLVRDFAALIDRYGHIPNGNRSYYLSRSQPPFFAAMVDLLAARDGPSTLSRFLPQLRREYEFWMEGASSLRPGTAHRRIVRLADGALLNRYWDDKDTPREESYREDRETARVSGRNEAEVYRNLRAAAESGWDFSSRWLADGRTLATIRTVEIVPVDLNSLLYHLEDVLARAYRVQGDGKSAAEFTSRARQRRDAMRRHLWDWRQRAFGDLLWSEGRLTGNVTAATLYPLYFRVATAAQARAVAGTVQSTLLEPDGLATTTQRTGQQWDAPNGWAPLQWIAIEGLANYGYAALARDIAQRWIRENVTHYRATGRLVEKYDVSGDAAARGGEYPLQDGFGWTNGVLRSLLARYPACRNLATAC